MLRVIRELFEKLDLIEQQTLECRACAAQQRTIDILKRELEIAHQSNQELNAALLRAVRLTPARQENVHTANDPAQSQAGPNNRNWNKVKSSLEDKYKKPHSDVVEAYWKAKNEKTEAEIPELMEALANQEKDLAGAGG